MFLLFGNTRQIWITTRPAWRTAIPQTCLKIPLVTTYTVLGASSLWNATARSSLIAHVMDCIRCIELAELAATLSLRLIKDVPQDLSAKVSTLCSSLATKVAASSALEDNQGQPENQPSSSSLSVLLASNVTLFQTLLKAQVCVLCVCSIYSRLFGSRHKYRRRYSFVARWIFCSVI